MKIRTMLMISAMLFAILPMVIYTVFANTLLSSDGDKQFRDTLLEVAENERYTLQTYLDTVNGGIAQLHEGSSTLNSSYGEFDAGVQQLAGVLTGMLGNLSVLTDGVNQLASQYAQLDDGLNAYTDGVAQLKAGVAQLAEGAAQLTGGTGELRDNVSGIDMGDELDSLLASLSGSGEAVSFTSAENTDVSAVQFALQTVAITAPEPAAEPEAEPVVLNFWQKLLKLFGLYKG